ncbi:hypothetical protein ACTTAI_00720 (plasmid) [Rhodobacter capsulatus]|uniref:hypothetical protein n=1 Tax=Rhodobacter capsulatus TaxID=1061 RepID=UPI004028651F
MDMPIKGWVVPPFTRDTNMVISELENDVMQLLGYCRSWIFRAINTSWAPMLPKARWQWRRALARPSGARDVQTACLAARHVGEFAEAGAIVAQRANMAPVHLLWLQPKLSALIPAPP